MKNENSASGSPGAMDARAIILSLNLWPEAPRIDPIPAGFTNENFRVFAGGQAYFARAGSDLPHHGISRRQEARCAGIAARAGIAPEVIHARDGVLVTRFIEGRALALGRTPTEATLASIAELLAVVHRQAAPPDLEETDLVRVCKRYLSLPGGRRLAGAERGRIERLLEKAPRLGPECLVHGDAFPENFIDDGRRLWLVDWEYAGRGHPATDIAYAAMNFDLSGERLRAFVKPHGGSVEMDAVRELMPVAAARDFLWCLSEIETRGLTEALAGFTELCRRRLDSAPSS